MSGHPIDDGVIPDATRLLRRIAPIHVVDDKNLSRKRPSSAAFKQLDLSVDSESLLEEQGLDWHFTLVGYPECFLVGFTAQLARSLGLPVFHRPLAGNPAHCEIPGKKRAPQATALATQSEWILAPP